MKSKPFVFNLFFIGIFLSSVIFSSLILDFTLTPRLLSISIIIFFTLVLAVKSTYLKSFKIDFILMSYIAYVVFSCFSILWANTATEAIFENTKLVMSLGVFLWSYYFFLNHKIDALNILCKISVIILFIELAFVSYQLAQLKIYNKEALYSVFGINSHKNLLSSYLYINLFFLVLGLWRMQKTWKYLTVLSLILNLIIISIIQTKAVWMALVISGLVFFIVFIYTKIKRSINIKWTMIIGIIIANLFFMLIQPQIIKKGLGFNELQVATDNSNKKIELDNERLQLWDKSYDMIKHYPLAGVGLGNWQIHFPNATLKGLYRAEDLNFTFQRPHNDILWIIAELGFIGFNFYFIFIFSIIIFLISTIKTNGNKKFTLTEPLLCLIAIIGFLTASFFDFPKERIEHLIWINITLALAYYWIKETYPLKTWIHFIPTNTHFVGIGLLFIIMILIGVYRFKGEYYTRKMYDCKKIGNNNGVIKEGRKAINFAYSIDPTSLPITWYTGNSYAIQGNFIKAKTDLMNAYGLNPYNRNVINDLASAYVQTNQLDSAKNYYVEAIRISPRFDDPKLNLAAIYFNEKRFEKADSCLKTLLHDSERRTQYQTMVNSYLGKTKE